MLSVTPRGIYWHYQLILVGLVSLIHPRRVHYTTLGVRQSQHPLMDQLLKQLKEKKLSVYQTYAGAAIHADDLRTTAESKDAVSQQANIIRNFAKTANLKLIASKLEVVRIGRQYKDQQKLNIAGVEISTTPCC